MGQKVRQPSTRCHCLRDDHHTTGREGYLCMKNSMRVLVFASRLWSRRSSALSVHVCSALIPGRRILPQRPPHPHGSTPATTGTTSMYSKCYVDGACSDTASRLVSSDSAVAAGVFKEPVTLVSPAVPPRDLYRPERLASPRPIISTSVRCMERAAPRRVGFFDEEQAEVLGDDRDHWGRGWFDRLTGDVSSSCCHAALLKRRADRVLSDTDDVQARARYEVVLEGVPHRAFLHTHSGHSR